MPIELTGDARDEALASLKRYFDENMDEPLGNLTAADLLDFFVAEIGPCLYNKAVSDVQERLHARILDLDLEVHETPFTYWPRQGRRG